MVERMLLVEDDVQALSSCFGLELLSYHRPWLAGPCIALLNRILAVFHKTSSSAIQSHTSA